MIEEAVSSRALPAFRTSSQRGIRDQWQEGSTNTNTNTDTSTSNKNKNMKEQHGSDIELILWIKSRTILSQYKLYILLIPICIILALCCICLPYKLAKSFTDYSQFGLFSIFFCLDFQFCLFLFLFCVFFQEGSGGFQVLLIPKFLLLIILIVLIILIIVIISVF